MVEAQKYNVYCVFVNEYFQNCFDHASKETIRITLACHFVHFRRVLTKNC